jgi:hypothetical protein
MRVTCIYNKHEETENCTEAVEGTLVRFDCAPFYEDLGLSRHPIHICRDGSWDQRRPECTPGQVPIVINLYLSINIIPESNYNERNKDPDRIIFPK